MIVLNSAGINEFLSVTFCILINESNCLPILDTFLQLQVIESHETCLPGQTVDSLKTGKSVNAVLKNISLEIRLIKPSL